MLKHPGTLSILAAQAHIYDLNHLNSHSSLVKNHVFLLATFLLKSSVCSVKKKTTPVLVDLSHFLGLNPVKSCLISILTGEIHVKSPFFVCPQRFLKRCHVPPVLDSAPGHASLPPSPPSEPRCPHRRCPTAAPQWGCTAVSPAKLRCHTQPGPNTELPSLVMTNIAIENGHRNSGFTQL